MSWRCVYASFDYHKGGQVDIIDRRVRSRSSGQLLPQLNIKMLLDLFSEKAVVEEREID